MMHTKANSHEDIENANKLKYTLTSRLADSHTKSDNIASMKDFLYIQLKHIRPFKKRIRIQE